MRDRPDVDRRPGTVAVTEFAVDAGHGQSVVMALGFAAANALEPYVSARLLLRHPDARDLDRPVVFRRFVAIGVILGPMLGAVVGATMSALHGATSSWLSTFGSWWAGDSLGRPRGDHPDHRAGAASPAGRRRADSGRGDRDGRRRGRGRHRYLAVRLGRDAACTRSRSVLVWAALRCGFTVVATVGFFVAWIADAATISGRGQYATLAGGDTQSALLYVQLFLGLTLIATLMLAAEAAERLRIQSELTRAEADRLRGAGDDHGGAQPDRRRGPRHRRPRAQRRGAPGRGGAPAHARRQLAVPRHPARGRGERPGWPAGARRRAAGGRSPRLVRGRGARGLAQLPLVVAAMGEAGVPVELRIEGEPRPLATLTDWSAYRVVQEALTNVLKHAGEAVVRVTISYGLDTCRSRSSTTVWAPPPAPTARAAGSSACGSGSARSAGPCVRRGRGGGYHVAPTCRPEPRREPGRIRACPRRRRRRPDADRAATIFETEPDIEVVAEAADGHEACLLADALAPDVVLMDVRLPQLDGISATRQIVEAASAGPPAARVVVLTTFDDASIVCRALEAGASAVLLKRVPAEELVVAVRSVAALPDDQAPAIVSAARSHRRRSGRPRTLERSPD